MPYEKITNYLDIPFCSESNRDDFYTYSDIRNLIFKCEMYKDCNIKCRTLGVLKSLEGKFFLSCINLPMNHNNEIKIRVSMKYLKTSPGPTFIPYTVQIFGTLQWKQKPVIFANLMQVINTGMAIRLQETLSSVTSAHLAQDPFEGDDMKVAYDT